MTKLCRNIAWMLEPLPSLNGLCAFEAVVRHGSFTRAALELGITRAAVGHRIRRLEQQLGVMLLQGQQRGIVPTEAAQACLPEIHAAFADLRSATNDLRRRSTYSALTVSVTPTLAAKWLMPRLAAFKADHPGIEVRISTSMHMVDFAHEPIDLAIRYGSGVWPGLRSDPLPMTDDIYPVCSPALLRGPAPLRHPHDLAAHTLLGVHYQRGEWRDWLGAAGIPFDVSRQWLRRTLIFDVAFMAIEAAIGGLGVALGYAPFVEADIASGRLIAPFDLLLPCTVGFDAYLVCPERTTYASDITAFRDWLLAGQGAAGRRAT
jgi:LysR family glycine cleavage system transcriptional activator